MVLHGCQGVFKDLATHLKIHGTLVRRCTPVEKHLSKFIWLCNFWPNNISAKAVFIMFVKLTTDGNLVLSCTATGKVRGQNKSVYVEGN